MKTTTVAQFPVIGIAIRTTNENGQSAIDIPQLWARFFSENILDQIPGKVENTIYSIYTDYELDYTKPYTTILGCRVKDLDLVPEGFTAKEIGGGTFTTFQAKGKMADGIVVREWMKIWDTDLPRSYTADFEVYDERSQNPDDAEVDIFIAVK